MMIEWTLLLVGLYLVLGLVFALAFHKSGLARIDPGVVGAGFVFRLLITPGIVALWPVLLSRWRRSLRDEAVAGSAEAPVTPGALRSAHRWLVTILALGLAPLVAAGLLLRPPLPLADSSPEGALVRPLPAELLHLEAPADELAVMGVLRGGSRGRRQIEIHLAEDLEIPALALYAAPVDDSELPSGSTFVGLVHGPGTLRFELPKRQVGVLIFYSLAQGRRVGSWEYSIDYTAEPRRGS